MRKSLISLTLVLSMFGCSPVPTDGTVYKKYTEPEHISIINNVPISYPEAYYLCLRNGEQEGCREVTAGEYAAYDIGDHYPKGM